MAGSKGGHSNFRTRENFERLTLLIRRFHLAAADDWEILELRRTEIAYVSQFFHVMPRVSALEILMEPLIARGVSRTEALDRAKEMLSQAGKSSDSTSSTRSFQNPGSCFWTSQ